jgi:S-adenosylmethionine/arginine decarboxylase-like enzyme
VFSCGEVLQPKVAVDYLVEQLGATRASVVELQRGVFLNAPRPLLHKPMAVQG